MALDLQLRAAFTQSVRNVDAAGEPGGDPSHKLFLAQKGKTGLKVAIRLLREARAQNNVPWEGYHLRSPELLVLAAETAVKNGEFDSAKLACHEFFLDGGGARDQFYCRALFVKALVVSNSITRDRLVGAEAMQRRSRAVDYLLQALDIAAEGGARYAFLVYNASVHAWNVLRTAFRPRRAGDHATELLRFSDALEASNDSDLRWRCNLLMAVSLALGDKGDASAAAAKAALSVQHAEDLARGEREAADVARGRLNEAKDRVAVAQAQIRKIEEAGTCSADAPILEDGGSEAGGAAEGSILSASASGSGKSWLGTGEKLAAAVTSRASAEKDSVEAGRKLTPLAKTAAEAAALAEQAWMFQAYSAAEGAAAGGSDATKVLEMLRSQASGDARREALLLQQEVAAGALTGDAVLQALNPVAEALDPGGVTLLAKAFAGESAGQGGEVETTNGKDTTAIGGGDVGGSGGRGGRGEKNGAAEPLLPSLPTPSPEAQSVFVDLGRTALKAIKSASPDDLASSSPHELQHSSLLLNFARACHLRASSSAGKGKPTTGGSGTIPSPGASKDETAVVSPAAFRARLELLSAELAAHGMLSGHTSDGDGNNDLKLDARRTDAAKLADRVEALKRVERLLLNCKRLGDPELLQEGCCLAFSIGVPLLGKRHRKHVHRCFSLAAQILQDVESPLARLRAQLHLEVAKCEVDSDFLAKATLQVEKALGQDYGVSDAATLPPEAPLDGEWDDEPGKPFSEGNNDRPRGGIAASRGDGGGGAPTDDTPGAIAADSARLEAINDTLRPLDRFMMPLASFLRLKTSVDVEPSTAEDKALLLIDQGKHAADPFLRRTLMARAAEQLYIATSDQEALDGDDLRKAAPSSDPGKRTTTANTAGVASSAARGPQQQQILMSEPPVLAKEAAGLNRKDDDDDEIFAARFAAQDADGSGEKEQAESIPQPSSKRLARLWFALLELAWAKREGGGGGGSGDGRTRSKGSVVDIRAGEGGGGRDAGLARKAAVAVLRSGPWSPERNRELVVLQARAQYMLGETYVEELRLADTDFLGSAGSDSQKPLDQVTDSNTGGDDPGPNSTNAAADPKDVTNKEESRGRYATKEPQDGAGLDPRTMGIPTAACTAEVSSGVADMLDGLKKKACGCFVGGMRRAARAKEPALIENGAVFVYNFHMPVWKRRLHHLVMPDLQGALEACVAALEAMERPDTALLRSTYEALARTMSSSPSHSATSSTSAAQAEEVCLRAILALDRPDVNASGGTPAASTAGAAAGGKGAGGVKGKSGNTKKGDAVGTKDAESCGGATSARRATVSELKGVVEVRAACQAARAGVAAVTGEGRPLFHALALLTAASVLSAGDGSDGATAATGDLVERCVAVMREYRGAIRSSTAARQGRKKTRDGESAEQGKSGVGAEATGASPAPAHEGSCSGGGGDGGGEGEEPEANKKIDLFAALSGRAGTSLEEDRAELELVGEIWCRLGKERLARGNKREAEECCGYVIELLPQIPADRRKVHPRLWRWLAVGEGLWGQAIASMVSPESQEKPLQDELRRVSMRHLALSAKFGTLASSSVVTLDIAKRLWNVALPLADTAAGRAIARSPMRAVLREMAKGGILEGGAVRAQLYVLLFECYSDRSEWKQGLAAVTDSLRCIPPEFQRPLWRWRVVFLSRLGITALDGVAKTKESDKVLQGKSWCTLARSAREPKQQLSAYLKALECLGGRFERLDCLVEMGEWATGRGLASAGADYLRAALDLLYDVEESAMQAAEEEQQGGRSSGQDLGHDGDDRDDGKAANEQGTRCRGEASSRASSRSRQSGLKRSASKASSAHGTSHGGSRGSSRGAHGSQGGASSSAEPDQNGYPETLTMGHLETAVRVLTMLARGAGGGSGSGGGFSCSMFDERLDLLVQAHYFVGRMAAMVAETVECGRRWRLYEENVPEGTERAKTPFQEWWDAHGDAAEATVLSPPAPGEEAEGKPSTGRPPPIASQPPVHLRDWASWRPESDPDLYRYMAVPPPGRAPYVLSTATIEKPPLLFHHLLDLAEGMEDQGLAAHAAAPLAMSELVARLCLDAPLSVPRRSVDGDGAKPEEMKPGLSKVNSVAGGGKGASAVADSKAGTGVGDGGAGENAEHLVAAAESFPALALACLRRSRLLLKLGPTCQRAALQAAAAAGPLGVSAEDAARRGAEVDRILRQREEEDSGVAPRRSSASHEGQQQQQRDQEQQAGLGGRVLVAPPSPDLAKATSSGGSKIVPTGSGSVEAAREGAHNGTNAGVVRPLPPTLGKLEDRKLWALLAKEAVLLGECQAAAEYLTAAQRHNDAFHDRENIVSCLEAQAALCDAQGHPEQGLPCLLRASALLRAPGVGGSTAGRWGKMTISIGGMMRKANMGDAKIRQALQTGCDALERSIFRSLDKLETGEAVGMTGEMGRLGASRSSMDTTNGVTRPSVVDLDAAIAFSGCISLLAEASGTLDDSNALAPPALEVSTAARGTVVGQERPGRKMRNMCTASNATATRSVALLQDGASDEDREQHRHQEHGVLPAAVRLLSDAADKLRPLGKHPALPAILRRMAQEWVRRWAKAPAAMDTAARSVETPAAAARGAARGTTPSPAAEWLGSQSTEGCHTRTETLETNPDANKQHVGITRVSRAKCLENAAACLAEARAALSALAAAAEPTGDVLSSAPPAARERAPAKNESDDDDAEAPAAKAKGKNGKGGAGSQKGGTSKAAAAGDGKKNGGGGGGGAASSTSGGAPGAAGGGGFAQGSSDAAVLSTPVGRSLVMVQLEEACVRAMLGRIRGEARSSKKAEEAAANDEGTNPVQRYLEASRPLGHPTPEEMEVPQLEQALALAQMARERCSLSSFPPAASSSTCSSTTPSATETGEGDDGKSIPTGETNAPPTGLLPLALAWEGSTLALLAARAGLCDEAWSPRPPPPRPATPPQATTPDPATATKGGKGAASKGGKRAAEKGGKGGKGGAAAAAVVSGDDDEKPHVDVPPIQEGFNLREQARWKLERAMEAAVAGRRWDAAGAAAFALAEMLGGDDAPSAAAALMLHQSCRARERMLRLLHTALPKSSRYRLCMDRVNTAQGSLRGMHNLDACDSLAVPRPVEAEASAVGAAGEGAVSSITEFPSSEASEKFLSANLAGWRRLDCAMGSNNVGESSLRMLPTGLGVLSLQFSPDGTTLYAAGYAPPSPSAAETTSGGTDNAQDTGIVPAANAAFVWRHEMKAREVRALRDLGSRMKAFQGSVKRHCLEKCDEEGKIGDYNVVESASISEGTAITPQQHSATPLPSQSSRKTGSEHSDGNSQGGLKTASSTATVPVTSSAGTLATIATAECEVELDAIIAATESLLLPVLGEGIDGSLAPFLARCREEELSLILLLDESLENLPLEACAALGGIRSVSRDLSVSLLHHRLRSVPDASRDDGVVSNARMRYVADPLSQDPGVLPSPAPRLDAGGAVAAAGTSPKGKERGDGGKKKTAVAAESRDDQEEWSGRPSILKVLRERVGQDQSKAGGGGGKGATGSVKVAAWKGVAGDDHVPGVPEWQALVSGSASAAAPSGGPDRSEGGFVFYGLGRCLSKLAPESIAGLSVNCKAAILIDRADNSASRRLESKQDTLKSPEEMDAEEPSQTAALFSLVGCQSVVLNMWSVTLHSNQRIICSLFRRWGEEGLTLGAALSAVRGETAVKPRARFGTVLYGLPTLKYGP